ncbi:MAG: molybdate ABC transporter substrate-binding protein [Alcanivoracaceae bacterium]|nr:molybdate ABC transporter substrate-binding protein [Alcanivoracaceae bacterium]
MFARLFLLLAVLPVPAMGDPLRIAVASNFHATLAPLAAAFSRDHGTAVELVPGASGALYAQLSHGAPFDLFFSADILRPQLLEQQGLAAPSSLVVYATGQLVLWQPDDARAGDLDSSDVIAIAQPRLAPYGAAAMSWLASQPNADALREQLVYGTSVSQAFHFVASGNASAGLVALSQVLSLAPAARGHYRVLPAQPDQPLQQAAVILAGTDNYPLARAFLDHVLSPASAELIRTRGYLPAQAPQQEADHAGQ